MAFLVTWNKYDDDDDECRLLHHSPQPINSIQTPTNTPRYQLLVDNTQNTTGVVTTQTRHYELTTRKQWLQWRGKAATMSAHSTRQQVHRLSRQRQILKKQLNGDLTDDDETMIIQVLRQYNCPVLISAFDVFNTLDLCTLGYKKHYHEWYAGCTVSPLKPNPRRQNAQTAEHFGKWENCRGFHSPVFQLTYSINGTWTQNHANVYLIMHASPCNINGTNAPQCQKYGKCSVATGSISCKKVGKIHVHARI